MKLSKIIIGLAVFLLPTFINAQESKEITKKTTENGITFTVSDIVLDSAKVSDIKNCIQQEILQQEKKHKEYNEHKIVTNNKIEAEDIISDGIYVYTLNVRDAYDDDYGPYYYTEWKITQYLKSSGEIVAETGYREGKGRFSTFKELVSQKDFRPVKECKLAQLAFQAMQKQEDKK